MKLNFTKKLSLGLMISLFALQASAQNFGSEDDGVNMVKLNFGSFLFKSFSAQYERALQKKMTVGIGFRFMPKSSLPFSSSLESADEQIASLKTSNIAITPEARFYFGKGVFKGFYVAPFVRFANYNASIDYAYDVDNTTEYIPLKGNLTTFTGGVLIGAQWRIANKVYFDWSIFGPQYGFSNGKISGKKSLNAEEQQSLKEELDGIDLPLGKMTSTVDGNGATVKFNGPWAGIRANLGIGYRF